MAAIRIVVADDHPSLRAGIRARLDKEKDIDVVAEAGNGEEALRRTMELKPHVLLLDMQMPDLSGIEVARQLKADEVPVRILALSAHADAEYIIKLFECGASGYLMKQEPLETILAAVRGVARGEDGWLSRVVAEALMRHSRSFVDMEEEPMAVLSEREREVLEHVARGRTNPQIAERLFISDSTVKKHVNNLYRKLEVGTRAEAVFWAWKNGVVVAEEE